MSHTEYNTLAILVLLLLILYYVSGVKGKIRGFYKRTLAQQYLNTAAKLRAVEFAPSAIISIDIDGNIVAWNKGATTIFGYKESEVLGKSLVIIIPEKYKAKHLEGIQKMKETGQSHIIGKCIEMEGMTKRGFIFPIELTIWRWTEAANVFYTGIIRDITPDKQKEKEIRDVIEMHERAEVLNKSGVWSWDVLNDVVISSDGFNEIFGIEAHKVDSTYLMKRVYYEDLKGVEEVIKRAFEQKQGYIVEYRVVATNGSLTKVRVQAETFFNENHELINITGTIHLI